MKRKRLLIPSVALIVLAAISSICAIPTRSNPLHPGPQDETPTHPGWTHNYTGEFLPILIDEAGTYFCAGEFLEAGDYIGLFYNSGSNLLCGGYTQWPSTYIAAWGANSGFSGFANNETLKWRIWKKSTNTVHIVSATYVTTPPFTITGTFSSTGFGKIIALSDGSQPAVQSSLSFPAGWSLFSLIHQPTQANASDFFANSSSNVLLIKNQAGQVFTPNPPVNSIGSFVMGSGYQSLALSSFNHSYQGQFYQPQEHPISLSTGWNLVGYPRTSNGLLTDVLQSIQSSLHMVKSESGAIFAPHFNIDEIGWLIPGEAYWIRVDGNSTLVYPSN